MTEFIVLIGIGLAACGYGALVLFAYVMLWLRSRRDRSAPVDLPDRRKRGWR